MIGRYKHNLVAIVMLIAFARLSVGHAEPLPSAAAGVVQNPNQVFTTPDYRGTLRNRTTLLGDWGGLRQELANKGVTLDGNLTQVTQGVTSGGIDTGWEYSGRGETTLNVDTAKAGLWPGGLLTVMGEGNFGNPLTKNSGSLFGTNANDLFPEVANSFLLPQVSYTQFFSPQFGLAVGKMATISSMAGDMNDFAHGKGGQQFLNPAFNFNPVSAVTVPYSTLGVSAIFLPTKDLAISAGVLDPFGDPTKAGFDSLWEDGMTYAAEGRYTTNFFDMKGHQLLAATYSTRNYVDLDQRAANFIFPNLPIEKADNSWSVYWNADQYVYLLDGATDRGVGVFSRFGVSDGTANPIKNFASVGLSGKGLIPGREQDGMGLGYFYTWLADNRITKQLGYGDAQGWEAYYEFALTSAIRISPDLQWVQPSQERVDSSWVAGLRLFLAL